MSPLQEGAAAMEIAAYIVVAIFLPLDLYGFLKYKMPGEYEPKALRIFTVLFVVTEIAFVGFAIFVAGNWYAAVLNLGLIGLVLVINRNRLRLHVGVWGLLTDAPPMKATPRLIRDFMVAVAKAYPKSEGWLVLAKETPWLTIRFNGKLCGRVECNDREVLNELAATLIAIHPLHSDGQVGNLVWYPVRLIYKMHGRGKVELSTSDIANP